MEQTEGYKNKLINFTKAIESFRIAMEIDISSHEAKVKNTLKSGQLQNFEFCVELMWKAVKSFLEVNDGIIVMSPKQAIKEFVKAEHVSENEYENLFEMLNDRNLLSHIYNENEAEAIIKKLPSYFNTLLKVLEALNAKK